MMFLSLVAFHGDSRTIITRFAASRAHAGLEYVLISQLDLKHLAKHLCVQRFVEGCEPRRSFDDLFAMCIMNSLAYSMSPVDVTIFTSELKASG